MKRQTRTLVVLAVAVVAASVASYTVYRAVLNLPARQVQLPTKKAVVAAVQMPVGTRLSIDKVKLVDWPDSAPLTRGFADVQDVVERGLVSAVDENEPLTETKLAPKAAGAGLPPTITPGMRAMSIKVNEVIGVAGFVVPGTHVDVLTVIDPGRKDGGDDKIARVVLGNVQVLTAGTRYDQEESKAGGKPIRSTVVTLMVSPADAERLALAQAEGELMLALRHPLDVDLTPTHGVRKAALFADSSDPAPAPVVQPAVHRRPVAAPPAPVPVVAAVPAPYRVETIRAAKRAEDVLR
jgi:pilus assembly protein CpaB